MFSVTYILQLHNLLPNDVYKLDVIAKFYVEWIHL